MKLGGGAIVAVIAAYFLGIDPSIVLSLMGGAGLDSPGVPQQTGSAPPPAQDEQAQFVSVVLADTEDTWDTLFAAAGARYQRPKLVLFSDAVQSACGMAGAAVGPFYCPGDQRVYIDLDFFRELHIKFKAPGDFAQAYVLAHEIGHHVQNLAGTMDQVNRARASVSKTDANALSVLLELQADCYAGIWAHHAHRSRNILEAGDLEEAMRAASAVGDDTIQKRSRGYVVPDAFTHGSAEQRMHWFRRGLESGRIEDCDTFQSASR
jgi:predicted metalloprotease